MDEFKQKRSINQPLEKKIKKLKNEFNRSITSIEHFSNELFYEIFDYLDGVHIYQAFSNLNHHFQQLLHSSLLLFQIKYFYSKSDVVINNSKEILCSHREQINSMYFSSLSSTDEFFSSFFIIDSSLNHLESIVLWEPQPDILISILISLTSLPRLFSLTLNMLNIFIDLAYTYQLVFTLPVLKYYKFSSDDELSVSLPISTNQRFSTIESLFIDHCCTFHELSSIISYTPELRRLKFTHDLDGNINIETLLPISLSKLTHLSTHLYNISFNEFELFLKKMNFKLKVLSIITQAQDLNFLDAHRWKQIIVQDLPRLKKFSLQYYEYTDDDIVFPVYLGEANQFTSSFWIERQCVMETEIDFENNIYAIRSYKPRWYDYLQMENGNSSIEFSKSARLIIKDIPDSNSYESILKHIKRILSLTQIYHLEILDKICFGLLIRIMCLLPALHSLKIHSISYTQSETLSTEENDIMHSVLHTNQITNIYLEEILLIDEIFILMTLCSHMTYLRMTYVDYMDIQLFLRSVFKQIKSRTSNHLCLLCFCVLAADDQMIKTLQEMIDNEELLIDYTIKRVFEQIYVQWK